MDPPLSEHGRTTAQKLSERLAAEQIDSIWCSGKIRALQTAAAISLNHFEKVPSQVSALNEINHGCWEGKTKDEVIKQWPDDYAAWEKDPFLFAPPNAEPAISVVARAIPQMDYIVSQNFGKTAVVVSHKATIRLILCHYLGIPYARYRDCFELDRVSLSCLVFKDLKSAKLTLFNDTSHYKGEGYEEPVPS